MTKSITILEEEIDQENFPELYKWAQINKFGLENTIKKMQAVDKSKVSTILIALENELQTDNS